MSTETTTIPEVSVEEIDAARPSITWLRPERHASLARYFLRQEGWRPFREEPLPHSAGPSAWTTQAPAFLIAHLPGGVDAPSPETTVIRFMRDGFLIVDGPERDSVTGTIARVRASRIAEVLDIGPPHYSRDESMRDIPAFLRD